MTLIVAADAQDHLILAGDHCAVMSGVSNPEQAPLVLDNYRKLYPWKYGAIAASGDVFLMVQFHRLFLLHEGDGGPIDLLQVAKQARQARSRNGVPAAGSVGNLFFTLPGCDGFELHAVFFTSDRIAHERIDPLSTQFSLREREGVEAVCEAFNSRLRPSFFFDGVEAFHLHHLDLLERFFAREAAVDDRVTSSFDLCMLEKQTGLCTFWHRSQDTKEFVFVHLDADRSDARSGVPVRCGADVSQLTAG